MTTCRGLVPPFFFRQTGKDSAEPGEIPRPVTSLVKFRNRKSFRLIRF